MNSRVLQAMGKGLILGLIGGVGIMLLMAPSFTPKNSPELSTGIWLSEYFGEPAPWFVLILSLFTGLVMGYLAGIIEERRRLRLTLALIGVYFLDALITSLLIVFFDPSDGPPESVAILDVIKLALFSLIIPGIIIIPILSGFVMILEHWTRSRES